MTNSVNDKGSALERLIEDYKQLELRANAWTVERGALITAAREEHTSLDTDNSELRDRLTAAVNAHEKLFSENATLHKIVGEMVETLKMTNKAFEENWELSGVFEKIDAVLARAKEIGEGR